MENTKQVATQTVIAILKKADVQISKIAPSSSKVQRYDGIVVEPCLANGKQEFIEVPTRVKGRKGVYHNWTKKVVVEEVVRISNYTNRHIAGSVNTELPKAIAALQAAGFSVCETIVASQKWNGLVEELFYVVKKVSN